MNAKQKKVIELMKQLDFCMMVTTDGRGTHHTRPMSNNREVEFDGDSWFFAYEDSNKIKQLQTDANVSLIYQGDGMIFMHLYGTASIVRQKAILEKHWQKELEMWFPKGLETPGVCLIHVKAAKVQYWHKSDEGTIDY